MTKPDTTDLRKRLARLIGRRAGSGNDVSAAARSTYQDLAAVFVPLVSEAGFEALVGRALQLAQREYPAAESTAREGKSVEPFEEVGLWLDRQEERNVVDATASVFAALAGLLITLIGESLTTRYLQKAWPEGFSGRGSKGRSA